MARHLALLLLCAACSLASAQDRTLSTPLVRQDFSDCGNADVSAGDASRVGGSVVLTRRADGSATAIVSLDRGTPNTTYHFFLKCVRFLGDVRTDANGSGSGTFTLPGGQGDSPTFDMYPEGAPAGNKFQSVRASFTQAPITGGQQRIGTQFTVQGACRPPFPFPSNNNPVACCSQPGLDYCGNGQCCDPGYCQSGRCCTCQSCNDKTTCCPGEYPDCQTCSLNSSNQQVCSTQENLCIDSDQTNGFCGDDLRRTTGKLPLSCDNRAQYCDLDAGPAPFCGYIPACIWDYPECALPGPMVVTPIAPSATLFSCELNFDPAKCMRVTGTDCSGATQTFATAKKTFCSQAITNARSPMATETLRFPSGCIPEGWIAGPRQCTSLQAQALSAPPPSTGSGMQTLGVISEKYIYRVLRAEEATQSKVFAKDATATYTVGGHITQGNVLLTQYISASTDVMTSVAYCTKINTPGRKIIVRLSVAKLISGGCQVLDVRNGEHITKRNKRAINFAKSEDEVLIAGNVKDAKNHIFYPCTTATAAVDVVYGNCGIAP